MLSLLNPVSFSSKKFSFRIKKLSEILKVLTESFFVEVFSPKLFVINVDVFTFMCRCFITEKKSKTFAFKFQKGKACVQCKKEHLLVN